MELVREHIQESIEVKRRMLEDEEVLKLIEEAAIVIRRSLRCGGHFHCCAKRLHGKDTGSA